MDKEELNKLTNAFSGGKYIVPSKMNVYTQNFYDEVRRNLYYKSFHEFFKYVFHLLEPATEYHDNFHVKLFCDLLQNETERMERGEERKENSDIIANVPPRTSKSLIFSVAYPVWLWIRIPTARIICVSYSENLVLLNARMSRDIIQNPDFQNLFGHIFKLRDDSKAVEMYANNRGGLRFSTTINSGVTGFSSLVQILDDPQDTRSAASAIERDRVTNNFSQGLYNRLTPITHGFRILTQQRLHERDLTGFLLDSQPDRWTHYCLPAIDTGENVFPRYLAERYSVDKDGHRLLDGKRLRWDTLQSFKMSLGGLGFKTQYQQEPFSTEDGFIKRDWFDIVDSIDYSNEAVQFFIDGAFTDKTKNDPSGLMACYVKNNVIYIVAVETVRKNFPELIKYITWFVKRYKYGPQSRIYIEPKASGQPLVQELRDKTNLSVVEDKAPERDKVTRLYAISPKVEARRVKLLDGSWNEKFLNTVCSISEKSTPTHDEEADLLCMAVNRLIKKDQPRVKFIA